MFAKRIFDILTSLILLLVFLPFMILAGMATVVTTGGPAIFKQKRWGRGKRTFTLYKFRTMEVGAEKYQHKLKLRNEADGPVFKIWDDPRYTNFGRFLAHTGLDELPQLINVLLGDMSMVGPRPLPVKEARKVPPKYEARFSVLPGITSSWIVKGSHKMSFDEWMKLDMQYIKKWTLWEDIKILLPTWRLMLEWVFKKLLTK